MAEESVVYSSSSVTSDGELSEEDLAKYSSLVRPYQDKPLACHWKIGPGKNGPRINFFIENIGPLDQNFLKIMVLP